jgi:hypothetical protein
MPSDCFQIHAGMRSIRMLTLKKHLSPLATLLIRYLSSQELVRAGGLAGGCAAQAGNGTLPKGIQEQNGFGVVPGHLFSSTLPPHSSSALSYSGHLRFVQKFAAQATLSLLLSSCARTPFFSICETHPHCDGHQLFGAHVKHATHRS